MTRSLRESPSLSSIKYEAKQFLKQHQAGDPAACGILRKHVRFAGLPESSILSAGVSLQEMQHALALDYGFGDWSALSSSVRRANDVPRLSDRRINLLSDDDSPVIGIDIGDATIKLVELSGNNNITLEQCGIGKVPTDTIREGNITNIDAAADALKRLLDHCQPSTLNSGLALRGSSVITKTIELPSELTIEEIETRIRDDAAEFIPFPLDQISLAFETRFRPNSDTVRVFLAACRRSNIDVRRQVLEKAGLQATAVDLEVLCAARAYQRLQSSMGIGSNDVAGVFIIGATTTVWIAMQGHAPPFAREQQFGGDLLTQAIADRHDITFDEAEARKKVGSLDHQGEENHDWDAALVQEIAKAQVFVAENSSVEPFDRILLAGGAARQRTCKAVHLGAGLQTDLLDPFKGMAMGPLADVNLARSRAPAFLLASGIALRGVTSQTGGDRRSRRKVTLPGA